MTLDRDHNPELSPVAIREPAGVGAGPSSRPGGIDTAAGTTLHDTRNEGRAAVVEPLTVKIDTPWTVAEIAAAREMWDQGLTTREIAARLSRSKNMVCGLARRQGFPVRGRPGGWGPDTVRKPKAAPAQPFKLPAFGNPSHGLAHLFPALEPREVVVPLRSNIRNPLPIPRGAIGPARKCQWTDCERAPWLFCEAMSLAGYSYCPGHKARVFRGIEE